MYNHWQKKWALSLGLLALAMLPAGCGNSIDDQFPFGKNRIHCGGETITVATPFELISNGKQVDLGDRQAETVHAEGHNANMQLLVTGTKEGEEKDAKTLAEEAKSILADNPNLKNVKSQQKEITLGDVKAQQLSFSFTETAREKNIFSSGRASSGASFTSIAVRTRWAKRSCKKSPDRSRWGVRSRETKRLWTERLEDVSNHTIDLGG